MAIIAKWLTMKAMVIEHAMPDTVVTTRYYREMFRADRTIPWFYRIYLACHDIRPMAAMRRDTRCMSVNTPEPEPPLGGVAKNIQSIVMVMGRVFAVIHAARIYNFTIESRVTIPPLYQTSRIWPPDHPELVFPRKPVFKRHHIDEISDALGRITEGGNVAWIRPG